MLIRENVFYACVLTAVVVGIGYVGVWIGAEFTPKSDATANLLLRLQQMAALTIVIERAVEVYLGVSAQNGPDRHNPAAVQPNSDAKRPASIAALVIGILVALVGFRILDTIGTVNGSVASSIWRGVDVVLSGGLLAGGAFLIHEVMEAIKGTIRRVDPSAKPPTDLNKASAASEFNGRPMIMTPIAHRSIKAQHLIDRCEAAFDANKNDGSAFVRSVAAVGGVSLYGQADDIVDQMSGAGWVALADGVKAGEMADAGMLVIAGLKGSDYRPARSAGHVAIVTSGALANGKYPTGYWGSSSSGTSGKNQTLNICWSPADLDNVHYAARSI